MLRGPRKVRTSLHDSAIWEKSCDLVREKRGFTYMIHARRLTLAEYVTELQLKGRLTIGYRFLPEVQPTTRLHLKVEINSREHFSVPGFAEMPFQSASKRFPEAADFVNDTGCVISASPFGRRGEGRTCGQIWIPTMGKKKAPPSWQEGRHEFDVVIPADKAESGEEETVRLGFSWKVVATRPMNARDRTRQEFDRAHELLDLVGDEPEESEEFFHRHKDKLHGALKHSVRAWCRTHLRCKDASESDEDYFLAFDEKAPKDLNQLINHARSVINRRRLEGQKWISMAEVARAVRDAVEAVLSAASRPPRNRRRFPARFRSGWKPRMPRVLPGSWIDTGRYRPAVVLEMMPDPPHIMKLSYGDEVDDDFAPHVTKWKPLRKRKRIPSLKDVFSTGDWIRHPYSGYGQLLAVRNSSMDVDYRGHVATVVPEAGLSRWKKVDGPGAEDHRLVGERLPPGTWIKRDRSGQGVVLAVEDDMLTVLFGDDVIGPISEHGHGDDGPVIWKLDRPALDLHSTWGRRWSWWWLHRSIFSKPGKDYCESVCACCGYPNLGKYPGNWIELELEAKECIICGYPDFGYGFDDEDVPPIFRVEGDWLYPGWNCPEAEDEESGPLERESKVVGYSLSEARRNYESRGVMFRPGEPHTDSWMKTAVLRHALTCLLEKRMTEASQWTKEDGKAVDEAKRKIMVEVSGTLLI